MLNNISRDGTWNGYDLDLYNNVQESVKIPLIGIGGAKNIDDVVGLIKKAGCSAAGVGSMVVFQRKDMGVLINVPKPEEIELLLHS